MHYHCIHQVSLDWTALLGRKKLVLKETLQCCCLSLIIHKDHVPHVPQCLDIMNKYS